MEHHSKLFFDYLTFAVDRVMRQELRPVDPRRGVHKDLHGGAPRVGQTCHRRKRQTEDSRNFADLGNGVQEPVKVSHCHGKTISINAIIISKIRNFRIPFIKD